MDRARVSAEAARVGEARRRLSQLPGAEMELGPGAGLPGEEESRKSNRFDFIFKVVIIGDAVGGGAFLCF
jgi:hypothetical protein